MLQPEKKSPMLDVHRKRFILNLLAVFSLNETQLRRFLLSLDFDGIFDINSMYNIVRIQLARTCKGPFLIVKTYYAFFVPLAFNGIIKNNKRKRGTCTGLLQSNIQ